MTHYDWTTQTALEAYEAHPAVVLANYLHFAWRDCSRSVLELFEAHVHELRALDVFAKDAIHDALRAFSNWSLIDAESTAANKAALKAWNE